MGNRCTATHVVTLRCEKDDGHTWKPRKHAFHGIEWRDSGVDVDGYPAVVRCLECTKRDLAQPRIEISDEMIDRFRAAARSMKASAEFLCDGDTFALLDAALNGDKP